MFRPCIAALALLLAHATASAQTAPVESGSRVRVTTAQGQVIGIVRSIANGSITLIDQAGDSLLITRSDLRSVELSLGWKSNGQRGAQLGSGAGFLLGIALGAFIGGGDDDPGAPDSDAFEGLATL